MADGLHKMRLAEPASAVDEEGIVGLGRRLRDSAGRSMRELVVRADDEGLERVPGIHPGRGLSLGTLRGHHPGRRRMVDMRAGRGKRRRFDVAGARSDKLDFAWTPEHLLGGILDQPQIVAFDEELMDRIWHPKDQLEPIVGNDVNTLKPSLISVGADPLPDHLGNRRPYVSAIQCHRKLCTRFQAHPISQTRQFDLS